MALTGMYTTKIWAKGDFDGTVEINFNPQETYAHAAASALVFFGDTGPISQAYMGIRSYRKRPNPNGPEQNIVFAADKTHIHDQSVSSVTFAVGAWDPCQIIGTANLFFKG